MPIFIIFEFNRKVSWRNRWSADKVERKVQRSLICLLPSQILPFPIINVTHQKDNFFNIKNEPTLIYHNYPRFILPWGFTLGVIYSMGLGKNTITHICHYIIQNIFTILKVWNKTSPFFFFFGACSFLVGKQDLINKKFEIHVFKAKPWIKYATLF